MPHHRRHAGDPARPVAVPLDETLPAVTVLSAVGLPIEALALIETYQRASNPTAENIARFVGMTP